MLLLPNVASWSSVALRYLSIIAWISVAFASRMPFTVLRSSVSSFLTMKAYCSLERSTSTILIFSVAPPPFLSHAVNANAQVITVATVSNAARIFFIFIPQKIYFVFDDAIIAQLFALGKQFCINIHKKLNIFVFCCIYE